MSKATVLALAITEAATASFRASGKSNIERTIWHETLDSSDFQKLVYQNLKPVRSLFAQSGQPTLADFRDFKNEFAKRSKLVKVKCFSRVEKKLMQQIDSSFKQAETFAREQQKFLQKLF